MSNEEHLIENLLSYIQSVGWAEANKPENFDNIYEHYGSNGDTEVSKETFEWLLNMAVHVVYMESVWGTDFVETARKE
jgi:hypothetical protein